MLGGIEVIQAKAQNATRGKTPESVAKTPHDLLLIPYYSWAHRGTGDMDVWLARNDEPINAMLKIQEAKDQKEREQAEKRKQALEKKERDRQAREKKKK
jgi:hypothetical protein